MLRIAFGITLLALLVLTYLANPVMAWVEMGTVFAYVFAKRSRQASQDATGVRHALRALGK
jgi:hypothetical protein